MLADKYKNEDKLISNYISQFKQEFDDKFTKACRVLEEITKHKLYFDNYNCILTTFPRCPYDENNGDIFFFVTNDPYWPRPIDNFMHEVLHFQFIYYWRNNMESPVSKLSDDEFEFLKESLAVILDDELKPLIVNSDIGYPIHQKFRAALHEQWIKNHDFNELVEIGVKLLPEFFVE